MLLKYHGVNDDFSDYSWYDNLYSLILHNEKYIEDRDDIKLRYMGKTCENYMTSLRIQD